MPNNLGRDLSRLARQSDPRDPRAPWWVNWLLQLAIAGTTIWALATGLDWLWHRLTGNTLGAVCWLVGLLPFGWLMPIGMIAMLVGVLLVLVGKAKVAGVVWLVLSALLYSGPEVLAALGIGQSCTASVL